MERRQLEYFLAVIDTGSLTAASRELRVAQPSLSQAIRGLERELGAPLFDRFPRGMKLTVAGEALEPSARQVQRDLEIARSSVQEIVGLSSGRIDLACLPTLALDPLSHVVGLFTQQYPAVTVRLQQPERSAEVLEMVRTGAAELGFSDVTSHSSDELTFTALGQQEMVLVLPPGSSPHVGAPRLADLLDRPMITGQQGTYARDLLSQEAAERGSEFTPQVEVERRETTTHIVLAGAGAAIMPAPLARITQLRGAHLHSLDPPLLRTISMVSRTGPFSPGAREFVHITKTTELTF